MIQTRPPFIHTCYIGLWILTSANVSEFNKTWKLVKSNPANKHVDFVEMNRNTLETIANFQQQ
jgi:hypothetical protein